MKQFNALLSLLDDPDQEVYNAVTDEFMKQGLQVIPELEKVWESSKDSGFQERLENVIHNIQSKITRNNLKGWSEAGGESVLEGALYVAQSQYPGVSYEQLDSFFAKITAEVEMEIKNKPTALEKTKLINYVVFHIYGFSRNSQNFFSPQNSYINQVIDSRKGTPLSLSLIYLVLAERLKLPIYGVNLPKNFILAFKNEYRHIDTPDESDDILFYINPYNKGAVINRQEIEFFLQKHNIEPDNEFYAPCSNKIIVARLLNNLIVSYEKLGYSDKIEMLKELLLVIH